MRWSRADTITVLLATLGALVVAQARAPLLGSTQRSHDRAEVYVLPPPPQMRVFSLGYRAAAADLIFGHVLVEAGVHLSEKRLFEHAAAYLTTISELDPKFRAPYRYADGIITLQAVKVPESMLRQARDILLRGTKELPYDQELWNSAGQYLAYLAPGWLSDPAEAKAFREEGARLLVRACELVGVNDKIPHNCITAAALFSSDGNDAATRDFLTRLLDVVDDPGLRALAEARLQQLDGAQAVTESRDRKARFNRLRASDLPFASRTELQALGPRFDPASCSGRMAERGDERCSTSFRELMASP